MPTYEYECRSCGAGFDVFQSMSDAPITVCPTCGQSVRRKINGGTGIIFKGSGFYKNDSRKASDSKSESSGEKADRAGRASEKSAREGAAAAPSAPAASATASGSSAASPSASAQGAPAKDAT